MNFAWGLKPLLIWLTICIGIDLDRSKKSLKARRWLITFIGLLFICLTIPVNIYNATATIQSLKDFDHQVHSEPGIKRNSYTMFLNENIAYIATMVLSIAFHLAVVESALKKWKPLWKTLKRIQSVMGDHPTIYRQLRRETILGLFLILTVTMIFIPSQTRFKRCKYDQLMSSDPRLITDWS